MIATPRFAEDIISKRSTPEPVENALTKSAIMVRYRVADGDQRSLNVVDRLYDIGVNFRIGAAMDIVIVYRFAKS
jgi:hypothetical protein